MEARQHLLAQVVVVTQQTPALAYNAVVVSRDHAGLQQGGQLARLHWLTTPRPVHLSMPPLMLWSSLPSVSRGLVYINTPGHTYLHELFIEYKASHCSGSPVFLQQSGGKLLYILSTAICVGWLNGHAHKSPPL